MEKNLSEKYWSILNQLQIVTIVATSARPGTDLLQSLFDSHPQILTFDGWLKFHSFYNRSISINGTQNLISGNVGSIGHPKIEKINPKDFFYEFAWSHLHKFNSRYDTLEKKDKLNGIQDYNKVDIGTFVKNAVYLIGSKQLSSKNAFLATYGSYCMTRGEALEDKKVLLHQAHLTPYIPELLNDFPKTKIIAAVRDPRHYASAINVIQDTVPISKISIGVANGLFRLMIDGVDPLSKIDRLNLKVNILEKLHEDPIKKLEKICNWIDIEYNSILLKSTWNGKSWLGDSLSNGIEKIFDSNRYIKTQQKWNKSLSLVDKIVIERLMYKEIKNYNHVKRFKCFLWHFCLPIFILIPTKYELRYIWSILKKKNYILFLYLAKIILSRYIYSYKKLLRSLMNKNKPIETF